MSSTLIKEYVILFVLPICLSCLLFSSAYADNADGNGSLAIANAAEGSSPTAVYSGTWGTCPWVIDADGVLTIYPGEGVDTSKGNPWSKYNEKLPITKVITKSDNEEKVLAPQDCSYLFSDYSNVSYFDLSNLDTSNTTSMDGMFCFCEAADSIDISGFDLSRVDTVNSMFCGCSSLISIEMRGITMPSLKYMDGMFSACTSLTSVRIDDLDAQNLISMSSAFRGCTSLTSVSMSNWKTPKVENARSLFRDCKSLVNLSLSEWDASSFKYLDELFYGCSSIESIDLSKWTDLKPVSLDEIFRDCSSLVTLDVTRISEENFAHGQSDTLTGCASLSLVKVGKGFTPGMPNLEVNGHKDWFSETTGEWYENYDIMNMRHCIEDIYNKVGPKSLSNAVLGILDTFTFSGGAIVPDVEVVLDGKALSMGKDYTLSCKDNVNVGTAKITITGKGGYKGTKTATFNIIPASISDATLAGLEAKVYTGKAITPAPTVKVDGEVLAKGADYTYSYNNNVNVGTATISINGKGNYTNAKKTTFKIIPSSIKGKVLKLSNASYTYSGKVLRPSVKTVGGKTLKAGVDYTVKYSNVSSRNVGAYTVTATGIGNYTGTSVKAVYKIQKADNSAKIAKTSIKKTGTAKTLEKKTRIVALPNVMTKFGKAKWKVAKRDAKKALSLSGSKVKVKKGTRKGTYTIKLRAQVAGTKNYKAAKSKLVTVTVIVK